MGNSNVTVDTNSDRYIRDKHFKGTQGLWELTRKRVNNKLVSEDEHLGFNRCSFGGLRTGCPIHISNLPKFKIISKLFLILDDEDSKLHYAKTR